MAIVLIGILNLFWCGLQAQFKAGYPSTGAISPTSGSNWYTDETRARVINIQHMGTFDNLVLDAANDFGFSEWQTGDRALIIQMKTMNGATSGFYRELEVNGYNSHVLSVEPNTSGFVDETFDPEARLQVIRIPRALQITLESVKVKCHQWDGNTGGVICFTSGHTSISKSIITASGCGFYPENVTFGIGGIGAPGDLIYNGNGGGGLASYKEHCLDPEPASVNKFPGTTGVDGDPQQTFGVGNGINGNMNFALNYGLPNPSNNIVKMGSAGYTESGSLSGGRGGYGGGHGGEGGLNGNGDADPIFGSSGEPGEAGGRGGNAGRGARGGGIILIKTMYFTSSDPLMHGTHNWLDVSGEPGENGKPGVTGGKPGRGGYGGIGYVNGSDVYYSGGGGGSGEPGEGAAGGDGSRGGHPGTILLRGNPSLGGKTSFFDFGGVGMPISDWINIQAGSNGRGGRGAYQHEQIAPNIYQLNGVGGQYEYCEEENPGGSSGGNFYSDICNCDSAMYPFEIFTSGFDGTLEIHGYSAFDVNVPDWKLLYDVRNGKLISVNELAKKRYHCRFNSVASSNAIMGFLFEINVNRNFQLVELPAIRESLGGSDYKLVFKDGEGLESANYFSLESDENYYLNYDLAPSGSYRADYSRCFPDNPKFEESGEDTELDYPILSAGNDGNTPHLNTPDGTFNDHFSMDLFTALMDSKNENENKVDLLIQQNLEQMYVTIVDLSPPKEGETVSLPMQIVLRDMQGRAIASYVTESSAYQIDLKGLSAGVYLVQVTSGEKQNVQKIIIQ